MELDRNTISGFSSRVRKNLDFMVGARANGEDVHIVTHLTCSLLGLIVFPFEHFRRAELLNFKSLNLDDLATDGWPEWSFYVGESSSLDNHLWHLRNALSHRRIQFNSNDRALHGVRVAFSDRPKPDEEDNWSTSINGAGLLDFVQRLSRLIDGVA